MLSKEIPWELTLLFQDVSRAMLLSFKVLLLYVALLVCLRLRSSPLSPFWLNIGHDATTFEWSVEQWPWVMKIQ